MSYDAETLFALLPAVYRIRDAAVAESLPGLLTDAEAAEFADLTARTGRGEHLTDAQQKRLAILDEKRLRGPLKALIAILAGQVAALEENVEQLYDDQFIETCAKWVVPYIADLVGYRPIAPEVQKRIGTARSEVANTIGYRRRKGTRAMLEKMAGDVTGWDAVVVEYFLRLATTQYMNHLRLDPPGTVDLREVERLEEIGTPFDRLAHTGDMRRIASRRGRYNIPNIGVFLWRVPARTLTESPAFRVDGRRCLFNPLGAPVALYNATMPSPAGVVVPTPIARRGLDRHLDRLYGKSFSIRVGDTVKDASEIQACDLSDTGANPDTSGWAHMKPNKIAVDPVLGRIAFPSAVTDSVVVSYHYGFSHDMGGGEYERTETLDVSLSPVQVPKEVSSVGEAVKRVKNGGAVQITGSGRYVEVPRIEVAADKRIELRAASGSRPMLLLAQAAAGATGDTREATGDLIVTGGSSGEVTINGLLISGRIVVPAEADGQKNELQKLRLVHCTLVPGLSLRPDGTPRTTQPSIEVAASNVTVEIDHCIVGALRVVDESCVIISDSIVDALSETSVAFADMDATATGGALTISCSTIVGKVRAQSLIASNSILFAALEADDAWTAPIVAERRQEGYLRYCYAPLQTQGPRRYACQPRADRPTRAQRPWFSSLLYGTPDYCQLHPACACEIATGADDGGGMGAFHETYRPQRESSVNARLEEYLPFGLEAGISYAS